METEPESAEPVPPLIGALKGLEHTVDVAVVLANHGSSKDARFRPSSTPDATILPA